MAEGLTGQKLNQVQKAFVFQGVERYMVERIIADTRCVVEHYEKGETIFDQRNFRSSLGILLSGSVQVVKPLPGGKYMTMSTLEKGECFGAAAMFQETERFATVLIAQKPVEVLFIPEEVLRAAMMRDFIISENYIRYLSGRIRFLNQKISSLTAGSVLQRLALFLLDQCRIRDEVTVSYTELGRGLNISRASLYRVLDEMVGLQLIEKQGRTIRVLDREQLRAIVESLP